MIYQIDSPECVMIGIVFGIIATIVIEYVTILFIREVNQSQVEHNDLENIEVSEI